MLKRFKNGIRNVIVKHAPYHGFSKRIVIWIYAAFLLLKGKYKKECRKIHKAMGENRPEVVEGTAEYKKLFDDVFYCCFIYGCLAKEYFSYEFNMLSHEGRSTFVTRGNKYPFYKVFNNPNYSEFLNKKTEMHRKFGEFYGRDVLALFDENDYEAFCEFVKKHPKFIYKPAEAYGGNGIKIYDSSKYPDVEELFKVIIYRGAAVVEELIKQGEALSKINAGSVNTVRFVTYHSDGGETIPQWSFLRMGSGNSVTDNMSSGGISARIDIDAGIICDYGRDYKRNKYMYHPDSGVQLIGYQMPEWDKAKALIEKCAAVMPEVRFIGWDLAYTENGWVLVEGNSKTQCVAPQVTSYGGMLDTYKAMLDLYNKENGGC